MCVNTTTWTGDGVEPCVDACEPGSVPEPQLMSSVNAPATPSTGAAHRLMYLLSDVIVVWLMPVWYRSLGGYTRDAGARKPAVSPAPVVSARRLLLLGLLLAVAAARGATAQRARGVVRD